MTQLKIRAQRRSAARRRTGRALVAEPRVYLIKSRLRWPIGAPKSLFPPAWDRGCSPRLTSHH